MQLLKPQPLEPGKFGSSPSVPTSIVMRGLCVDNSLFVTRESAEYLYALRRTCVSLIAECSAKWFVQKLSREAIDARVAPVVIYETTATDAYSHKIAHVANIGDYSSSFGNSVEVELTLGLASVVITRGPFHLEWKVIQMEEHVDKISLDVIDIDIDAVDSVDAIDAIVADKDAAIISSVSVALVNYDPTPQVTHVETLRDVEADTVLKGILKNGNSAQNVPVIVAEVTVPANMERQSEEIELHPVDPDTLANVPVAGLRVIRLKRPDIVSAVASGTQGEDSRRQAKERVRRAKMKALLERMHADREEEAFRERFPIGDGESSFGYSEDDDNRDEDSDDGEEKEDGENGDEQHRDSHRESDRSSHGCPIVVIRKSDSS